MTGKSVLYLCSIFLFLFLACTNNDQEKDNNLFQLKADPLYNYGDSLFVYGLGKPEDTVVFVDYNIIGKQYNNDSVVIIGSDGWYGFAGYDFRIVLLKDSLKFTLRRYSDTGDDHYKPIDYLAAVSDLKPKVNDTLSLYIDATLICRDSITCRGTIKTLGTIKALMDTASIEVQSDSLKNRVWQYSIQPLIEE